MLFCSGVHALNGVYNHSPLFSKSGTGIASFHDNSAIIVNPANLSFIDKGSFLAAYQVLGSGNVSRKVKASGTRNDEDIKTSDAPGGFFGNEILQGITESFSDNTDLSLSLSRRYSEKLTWGIGYFVLGTYEFSYPAVSHFFSSYDNQSILNLEKNFSIGNKARIKNISRVFQLASAYQLTPTLSLGASLGFIVSSVDSFFGSRNKYTKFSDHALMPQIRLGANYHITNDFRVGFMASTQANSTIKEESRPTLNYFSPVIPSTLGVGFFYDFGFFQVDFDMLHYMYSSTSYSRLYGWENSNSFQINIEKQLDKTWSLGIGVMNIEDPIKPDHRLISEDNEYYQLMNTFMAPYLAKTYYSAYISYKTKTFDIDVTFFKAVANEKMSFEKKHFSDDKFDDYKINFNTIEVEDALVIKTKFKF